MRRISLAMVGIAMAALVTMVSCRKPKLLNDNTVAPRTMTFNAKTEMGGWKTSLDGLNVNWSAGDQLSINGESFTLSAGAGTTFASFTSDGEVSIESPYYAAYPVSTEYTITPNTLTFNLPATRTYDATEVAIPMVAVNYSELSTLYFKNVVNVLKLQLEGDGSASAEARTLKSIVFTSTTSNLNGDVAVTFDGDTPNVGTADGTSTTTLSFGDDGRELASGETTNVYVVLPKIAGGDLRIKFNCANGKYMKKGITVTSEFNAVNNMLTAPLLEVNATTDPVAAPSSVTTVAGCSGYIYSMGGTVTLPSNAAQEVEYGFVCTDESDRTPEIGAPNCFKVVGGVADMPAGKTSFSVDITGLTVGTTYKVRAYAIGENGTVVYASSSTGIKQVTGGDSPQAIPSNWVGGGTQGASPYLFTVGKGTDGIAGTEDDVKVRFSQGNLQYIATGTHAVAQLNASAPYGNEGTWKFAEHQFDFLGKTTGQDSEDQGKTRDLFGWGTSGWNNGNHFYQPYNTDNSTYGSSVGYGYGPTDGSNLTGGYANSDWGVYNTIDAGGAATTGWRTLTAAEWGYLLSNTNNSKWAFGTVGSCTQGLIILPDGWTSCPAGCSFTGGVTDFTTNVYTYLQWHDMESAGAVFLPAAGYRKGTSVLVVGLYGYYWSSSYGSISAAPYLRFNSGSVSPNGAGARSEGRSVRLVR